MYDAAPLSSEQIGAAQEMGVRLRWNGTADFHGPIRSLLSVGALVPHKRHRDQIDALALVPDARLTIAGTSSGDAAARLSFARVSMVALSGFPAQPATDQAATAMTTPTNR